MAKEPTRIHVEPGSELAELLARAGAMPVLLETEGAIYRLDRMPKEATLPTPEEVSRSRSRFRSCRLQQRGDVAGRPQAVRDPSLHRRRAAERLVDADEVVVHVVERERVL